MRTRPGWDRLRRMAPPSLTGDANARTRGALRFLMLALVAGGVALALALTTSGGPSPGRAVAEPSVAEPSPADLPTTSAPRPSPAHPPAPPRTPPATPRTPAPPRPPASHPASHPEAPHGTAPRSKAGAESTPTGRPTRPTRYLPKERPAGTPDRSRGGYDRRAAGRAALAVAYARGQLGKPYRWGGAGPDAFDCSGLTMRAWAAAGVRSPHRARLQWLAGRPVSRADLRPGDLIIMNGGGHVGLYAGGGLMLHAPTTGDHVRYAPVPASVTAYVHPFGSDAGRPAGPPDRPHRTHPAPPHPPAEPAAPAPPAKRSTPTPPSARTRPVAWPAPCPAVPTAAAAHERHRHADCPALRPAPPAAHTRPRPPSGSLWCAGRARPERSPGRIGRTGHRSRAWLCGPPRCRPLPGQPAGTVHPDHIGCLPPPPYGCVRATRDRLDAGVPQALDSIRCLTTDLRRTP